MADRLMRLLFRPGWRLRCVDPPIAWIQVRGEYPPTAAIRLQLTCYLTSRLARSVWLRDSQLRITQGEHSFVIPMSAATNAEGEPFKREAGLDVYHDEPEHALVDFVTDAPDLIGLLQEPGAALSIDVEALLNDAIEFKKIADLELERPDFLHPSDDWRRVNTGRSR